ncbi:hypothetical protein EZV61_02070 [Corallincola luteus]|uniref:ATP synthase F0 subunit 8 n=1 Tax=Corallincola luteus TaxID=1775177 RepID=A0ABY2ANM3_9GAMM|nr:hypothetical protein [Corallincola luteus]TCI04780.1 hypothetical protein EZV61_02070 [Corallincola luteus]
MNQLYIFILLLALFLCLFRLAAWVVGMDRIARAFPAKGSEKTSWPYASVGFRRLSHRRWIWFSLWGIVVSEGHLSIFMPVVFLRRCFPQASIPVGSLVATGVKKRSLAFSYSEFAVGNTGVLINLPQRVVTAISNGANHA